jgi:hypothetical protein
MLLRVLLQRLGDLQPVLIDEVILVACHVAQWLFRRRSQSWVVVVQLLLGHLEVWGPGS